MDLGAYAQIENLDKILVDNGITVPRLRGLRLMSQEKAISADDISESANQLGLQECEALCESDFRINAYCFECSDRTRRIKRKYLKYDTDHFTPIGVRWDRIHGKKRKKFKYVIKTAYRRNREQLELFNRYCGRPDVLYIHARIGGGNWPYYCNEVKDQPWFICRIDDAFDSTYCDIYATIKPPEENND